MPIYEFECKKCGNKVEKLILDPLNEDEIKCQCGSDMIKIISLNSFKLNGEGWAKDGYSTKNIERKKKVKK